MAIAPHHRHFCSSERVRIIIITSKVRSWRRKNTFSRGGSASVLFAIKMRPVHYPTKVLLVLIYSICPLRNFFFIFFGLLKLAFIFSFTVKEGPPTWTFIAFTKLGKYCLEFPYQLLVFLSSVRSLAHIHGASADVSLGKIVRKRSGDEVIRRRKLVEIIRKSGAVQSFWRGQMHL